MKTKKFILDAYENVEYYKHIYSELDIDKINSFEQIKKLPLITKPELQNNYSSFISNRIKYIDQQELMIRSTSGSSGQMIKIIWDKKDYSRALFNLWLIRNKVYKLNPSSKFITFHSMNFKQNNINFAKEMSTFHNGINLSLSKIDLDENKMYKYYKEILDFEPQWAFLQPSMALKLSDFLYQRHLKLPSLRYIELTGEYISEFDKDYIKKILNVPICNMYGCEEAYGIASECKCGKMHLLQNNVYIEILNDNNEPIETGKIGDIYITNLNNRIMPLIRYKLGDKVRFTGESCLCGNKSPVLEVCQGRYLGKIKLPNGKSMNSDILIYPFEVINSIYNNIILKFKVVQKDINHLQVFLIIKDYSCKKNIEKIFIRESKKIGLAGLKIMFIYTEKIEQINGDKFKYFESEI